MDYKHFATTYHRWRHTPRTAGQAFKDADYASPLQVYVSKRRTLIQDALAIAFIMALAFYLIAR